LDYVIDWLEFHQQNHYKEYYYDVRSLDRKNFDLTDVEKAARTIYLNRTCYNGLYRVNSKKQFNVPIGSYKNPRILYRHVLEAANQALQNTCIQEKDFREIITLAQPGDFFYFDPPYDPVSKTSSFTGYTAGNFGDNDQQDLAEVFRELNHKGCLCMLSNSYTPFILDLYKDFKIQIVNARRAVNSDANGRGKIREVVVLNYRIEKS
jgi:DNA adenine methylase